MSIEEKILLNKGDFLFDSQTGVWESEENV